MAARHWAAEGVDLEAVLCHHHNGEVFQGESCGPYPTKELEEDDATTGTKVTS